jgi:hypothetical protein
MIKIIYYKVGLENEIKKIYKRAKEKKSRIKRRLDRKHKYMTKLQLKD